MILCTGGAGFIGSNFVHTYIDKYDAPVLVLDKLTYAANKENLLTDKYKKNIIFVEGDIGDHEMVAGLLLDYKPTAIVNFAAESHVDRSIDNATPFIQTNIVGTENLLHAASLYYDHLKNKSEIVNFKFIHISTDEVYGSLSSYDEATKEHSPYKPRSIYSASKAASDHLAMAYFHTHGLPVIITHSSNNYGPHQHREKFIPTIITKALKNEKIPVYGTGKNIRDWIYVVDNCLAIMHVMEHGRIGEKYNIGGNTSIMNLNLAKWILDAMFKPSSLIEYVEDRKGHDFRYDINTVKINDLGWSPKISLDSGLLKTIAWFQNEEVKNEQDTRHHPRSGTLNQTVPGNPSHNQTTITDLRQAADLLSANDIDVGRNKGHSGNNESLGDKYISEFIG